MNLKITGLLLACFIISGCASARIADFTIVSTKNISLQQIDISKPGEAKILEGQDSKSIILFFPTGIPNIKDAIDRALEKGNGVYMTDAVVYYDYWWIPYIYGKITYTVKGKVWPAKN